MPDPFTCRDCGASFTVPESALSKYPGWTPKQCMRCRTGTRQLELDAAAAALLEPTDERDSPRTPSPTSGPSPALTPSRPPSILHPPSSVPPDPLARLLARHTAGPHTGIFTDGFCDPNPGRGGWGAVKVRDGEVVDARRGGEDPSTNNRMELRALIEAYRMLDGDEATDVYSDSQYCVKTITLWAPAWEAKGWKKKDGAIMNLELVQELYALANARPAAKLQWIRGHAGSRWNEYADALARLGADSAAGDQDLEPRT